MTRILASLLAGLAILVTRLVTGVQTRWLGCGPSPVQRIYFANHTSHGDFLLVWTVLPPALRARTRPVAAADYWLKGPLRGFIAREVFRSVLIDRERKSDSGDPLAIMGAALGDGASLILFPEGTRNATEAPLLPFKSGIYRLARDWPGIELVPVWLANQNRVLPKGEILPVPLLCSITFGAPLTLAPNEAKRDFLDRARAALLDLAPAAPQAIESRS